MRKCPVLTAAGNFFSLRMDRDHSATRERADVRTTMFIERKVPAGNRPAAVAQGFSESVAPLDPIGGVIRAGVVGASFSPVHLGVWMCVMDSGHHFGAPS